MAKLIIDNQQIAEEFFEDARLLGIQCPVEAHRFVWMANRHFGYRFAYQNDGEIRMRAQKREYEFPIYHCRESNMEIDHYLYLNNDDGKHLLSELKHIDFLWLLKGESTDNSFVSTLMSELRKMDQVLLVVELTNEKIKHKEHLVI
jgi:hypothetical protein